LGTDFSEFTARSSSHVLSAATRAGASAAATSLLPRKSAGLGDAGGEQLATSYTPASRVPSDSASISQVFFNFFLIIYVCM
jgi:hypothetical protein